jgi:hypothetical protein
VRRQDRWPGGNPRCLPHGRGSFRTRATTRIENVTPRRQGIIVTELPYLIGPEKVIEKIKDLVQSKKLQGISDVKDLTDRKHGLQLVIEIKGGFHPQAVLEQLFKLTPMEDNFGINNVALVDGQPRTLGLKDLLRVYVDFRLDVVRRRSAYRLRKREERLHLVEGLLIAIMDIDEVIQVIRASEDATVAKARLMDVFDLSDPQATYILDLQLRRLTKFSRVELDARKGRAGAPDRGAAGHPGRREPAPEDGRRTSSQTSPRRTGHRVARCCWSRPATPLTSANADGGDRRPLLGTAVLHRSAGAHDQRRGATERGRPAQARRGDRCRADHHPGSCRAGHLARADDPALGTGAARPCHRPTARPRCPAAPLWRRSSTFPRASSR